MMLQRKNVYFELELHTDCCRENGILQSINQSIHWRYYYKINQSINQSIIRYNEKICHLFYRKQFPKINQSSDPSRLISQQRKAPIYATAPFLHPRINAKRPHVPAKNLQQLAYPVEMLRLVDKLEEDVIDLLPDEGAQAEKFAVYPVQHRLKIISLAGVLTVEQLQQLHRAGRGGGRERETDKSQLRTKNLYDSRLIFTFMIVHTHTAGCLLSCHNNMKGHESPRTHTHTHAGSSGLATRLTCDTNLISIHFFAICGLKSPDSSTRKKNSYTIYKRSRKKQQWAIK